MIRTNISTLKARLSSFLARVRAGEVVLVLDRNAPVAQISGVDSSVLLNVQEPRAKARALLRKKGPHIALREGIDVVQVLREDRDSR